MKEYMYNLIHLPLLKVTTVSAGLNTRKKIIYLLSWTLTDPFVVPTD